MYFYLRTLPPITYKESPEGEQQTPQAISGKELYIQSQQNKNAVVIAPKLFFCVQHIFVFQMQSDC